MNQEFNDRIEGHTARVFPLKGNVQHYAWGGHRYIPELLSIAEPGDKPYAEYWLGAHDNAPATVFAPGLEVEKAAAAQSAANAIGLNAYIRQAPEARLGAYAAGVFGRLPYLLKILDVKDMLSIQVHPSKERAVEEFAAENAKGIALNAPDRNYKDDNHKPELMVALSEFWLLHGFKSAGSLNKTLSAVPELAFLTAAFEKGGYKGLYQLVMDMEQAEVNRILQPLLDRIIPAYEAGKLDRVQEDFWAARAALTFNTPGRIDRGIFSIYIFNLVNLHPGEAIFQDAGLPHAYLEGQNVEIMANSDNVLRGGLTPKHIDVPELLKHVVFEETLPNVIKGIPEDGEVATFYTPAPDFELSRISLKKGSQLSSVNQSVSIFIVLAGGVEVSEQFRNADGKVLDGPVNRFVRGRGEAFVAFDQAGLWLNALEDTEIYCAAVPMGV